LGICDENIRIICRHIRVFLNAYAVYTHTNIV
jgi:hypothetical protein